MPVAESLDAVSGATLRRLHRGAILDPNSIVDLFERARRHSIVLQNGVNRRSEPRTAVVRSVSIHELVLDAPNLLAVGQPQIYFHLDLAMTRYFFATPPISGGGKEALVVELPVAVYKAERRDLYRASVQPGKASPRVLILDAAGRSVHGLLRDWSYQGLGISIPTREVSSLPDPCKIHVVGKDKPNSSRFGVVRRLEADAESPGWTRIGFEVSTVGVAPPLEVEKRDHVLSGGVARRVWRKVALAGAIAKRLPAVAVPKRTTEARPEVVEYTNSKGQSIVGLVDQTEGDYGDGGVAVVIPPAWGRTKETFLALARTIIATYESNGVAASVLRFDGTNRRGESFVDTECRSPGDEYLHFKFSQAVDDVRSSLDFVRSKFSPDKVVLVTFSLGAVEGRRALALEAQSEVDGWVSVVGMVDLQSGLRTVSGGLDFAYGQSMGLAFGRHELVGVVADMDLTGSDAFEHSLVFLEDAKRDMAAIDVPVTWLHGRFDAWMDLERVRALMAAGRRDNRRLIEIPSGHQMRSSAEALDTFRLISSEVFRMSTGADCEPALPDLAELEVRSGFERARRPAIQLDKTTFWSDYLLGRDRRFGFELMSATSPYRELMAKQIQALAISDCTHLLDLGGGTGDFAVNLAESCSVRSVRVTQIDLVPDALRRSRARLRCYPNSQLRVQVVAADFDGTANFVIPLRAGSIDSIIASLVLSYLEDPALVLEAAFKTLVPGGRIVVSSMKRDADISRIYVDSIAELPPDRRRAHFGTAAAGDFDNLQRVFLNDAAKLVQMEEEGRFAFFDGDELGSMLVSAGFDVISVEDAFGDPPQAVVVTAIRPPR